MGIFGHMTANAPMKPDEGGGPSDPEDSKSLDEGLSDLKSKLEASITEMSPARNPSSMQQEAQEQQQTEPHFTIDTSPTRSTF